MKRMMAALVAVVMAGAAWAQGAQIEETIGGQFEAFERQDVEGAFAYASPSIQGMFGSPERFGMMVRQGYPMVWKPGDVRFLELREIAGALWQMVQVTDRRGGIHILDYQMIEGPDGWRINGVQILPTPDPAV